jgi:hypothetical protein
MRTARFVMAAVRSGGVYKGKRRPSIGRRASKARVEQVTCADSRTLQGLMERFLRALVSDSLTLSDCVSTLGNCSCTYAHVFLVRISTASVDLGVEKRTVMRPCLSGSKSRGERRVRWPFHRWLVALCREV